MVKAKFTDGQGHPVVILGLSAGNCQKLQEGQPIVIYMSELGAGEGRVIIMGGETEQDITRELSQFFHLPS